MKKCHFVFIIIIAACTVWCGYSRVTEDLTNHLNNKFAHARDVTEFKFGAAADPHYFGYCCAGKPQTWRQTCRDWAKNQVAFAVLCGDLQFNSNIPDGHDSVDLASPVPMFALTDSGNWPYTATGWKEDWMSGVDSTAIFPPGPPRPIPPVLPCMGNHESDDGQSKRMWVDLFLPGAVAETSWVVNPNTGLRDGQDEIICYSFNYGNWHFVCLDHWKKHSTRESGGTLFDEEKDWLLADLHAHRGRPTAVFLHPPLSDAGMSETNKKYVNTQQDLHGSIFSRFPDVKWMFSGHTHDFKRLKWSQIMYSRISLYNGAGFVTVAPSDTFYSYITGGATPGYYRAFPGPDYTGDAAYYHGAYYRGNDDVTNIGSLPAPYALPDKPVPGAPGGLSKRSGTDSSITLQWTEATNADYYVIHRDGDSVGVSLFLNFTDYGLSASFSYDYEVYARNISDKTSASAATGAFSTSGTTVLDNDQSLKEGPHITLSPNPFRNSLSLSIRNSVIKEMDVLIYDVRGNLVYSQAAMTGSSFAWNGKDQTGRSCPNGVYVFKIKTGSARYIRKASLLR
jgi:hypothetical protein